MPKYRDDDDYPDDPQPRRSRYDDDGPPPRGAKASKGSAPANDPHEFVPLSGAMKGKCT